MKRKTFLEFLGSGAIIASLPHSVKAIALNEESKIKGIAPSLEDEVVLADGLNYYTLISYKDPINRTDTFGFNNDFNCFISLGDDEAILWTNHEYIDQLFVSGYKKGEVKTKEQVDKEMYNVGGSIINIKKKDNKWTLVPNHVLNQRITGFTDIPFDWHSKIRGKSSAMGTLSNCSGGLTPWGTILTCEENYDGMYGERNYETDERIPSYYQWEKFYDNPPEHYGWVVEINPKTLEKKKLVALGRCAHECATVHSTKEGRVVVYSGDDSNDECLYKYISDGRGDLRHGTLYVANLEKGCWESLDFAEQKILQKHFKNQTEVLIRLRESSKLVGGTPLDRPEDIEIDPLTGNVLISLTNNYSKGNYHGQILKIREKNGDHESLKFTHEVLLAGGEETGFACPDNIAFDKNGNLYITSDISGGMVGKEMYQSFKNNGLFVVPRRGPQAGKVIQIASAPNDAEFTGPWFSDDYKTLFLSVQHPGEQTNDLNNLTSNWPNGNGEEPLPSVICIEGKLLEKLTQ